MWYISFYIGDQTTVDKMTVARYHGIDDFDTNLPSLVINRYDASYYSGTGTAYAPFSPPINRFIWSFLFLR